MREGIGSRACDEFFGYSDHMAGGKARTYVLKVAVAGAVIGCQPSGAVGRAPEQTTDAGARAPDASDVPKAVGLVASPPQTDPLAPPQSPPHADPSSPVVGTHARAPDAGASRLVPSPTTGLEVGTTAHAPDAHAPPRK